MENAGIPSSVLQKYKSSFEADPKNKLAQNVVTKQDFLEACYKHRQDEIGSCVSHKVPDVKPVSNQKASGRCWLFALLNVMRQPFMAQQTIDEFEFSQNYLYFWDKLERCNYLLDVLTQVAKKGEPVDGRLVQHLLTNPSEDGGQWDMLVNLVEKHGVIPKSCWREAHSAENSRRMNGLINDKMREFCQQIFKLVKTGSSDDALKETREKMMETIYRIVSICLGSPPETFTWEYYDKEKKYHKVGPITPREFYKQLVKPVFNMEDKVCIVNDPRTQNPYNEMYTVEYLGNMLGGNLTLYLNQPIENLKTFAADAIKQNEAVWFGCDVGKFFCLQTGIQDLDSFDYELVFGTTVGNQSKADRLIYGQSLMTHAMVLTGVTLEEDDISKSRRWRVENSWGDEKGDKGYLVMADNWFNEYVYEVVVDKKHIPAEILDILKKKARMLPAWDPMGALA
ncbi:bleomycin hydrolase-like [Lineus longissimus]|uniref:bleomycin hydrolase-like n=1 Tax=Lineus longissimus TaxID=88925 RepID=UPI002B4EC5A5